MFVAITNTPRDYAWGSQTAIADLFGSTPSGRPEAEVWFGAHYASPSKLVPTSAAESMTLDDWLATHPDALGSHGPALPFLLKVLAAARPLSLQAHPTTQQAVRGFEREDELGIPRDAPQRNYRDRSAKPEILLALSDEFTALCGFRDPQSVAEGVRMLAALTLAAETRQQLQGLIDRLEHRPLAETFEWIATSGAGVPQLVDAVVAAALEARGDDAALVRMLAAEYPGDRGIVVALLLNRVSLRRGEALYVPAGRIHAYLQGLGVELMSASDNVLRGGLTAKHVDVPELVSVLDFMPDVPAVLRPGEIGPSQRFESPDGRLRLDRVQGDVEVDPGGPAVLLCIDGAFVVTGAEGSIELAKGAAAFASISEGTLRLQGCGELFVASGGRGAGE